LRKREEGFPKNLNPNFSIEKFAQRAAPSFEGGWVNLSPLFLLMNFFL
jgi:hypothetical protein